MVKWQCSPLVPTPSPGFPFIELYFGFFKYKLSDKAYKPNLKKKNFFKYDKLLSLPMADEHYYALYKKVINFYLNFINWIARTNAKQLDLIATYRVLISYTRIPLKTEQLISDHKISINLNVLSCFNLSLNPSLTLLKYI